MKQFDKASAVFLMLISLYLIGAACELWPAPPPPPLYVMAFAFFGWGYNLWRRIDNGALE